MQWIDFRSDTVTRPTEAMRQAMACAEVGDDVYGDDPTVNRLEALASEMVGKEGALFVPSGTMGNQLAIFTHIRRGNEVILGDDCHIVMHECGAAAIIAGAQLRCLPSARPGLSPGHGREDKAGIVNLADMAAAIRREKDLHEPETGLICLENAHSWGTVFPLDWMRRASRLAREAGIPVHLDGARLFNAALFLGVPAKALADCADSVMFCLSKGLCAPVGSILAGSRDFIEKARRGRKIMGGAMRQAGVLAAAGLIALTQMVGRLEADHRRAAVLAGRLSALPGVSMPVRDVDINMVYADFSRLNLTGGQVAAYLREKGILVNGGSGCIVRFVANHDTDDEAVGRLADTLRDMVSGCEISRMM